MKRYLAYLALIAVLAPVESTLPRLPGLHHVHVLLLVPLVAFFALHLNTLEGLVLSYIAGFAEEATVGYTAGLAAFAMIALFLGARIALATIRTDGPVLDAFFSVVLAALFFAITWGMRRKFETGVDPAHGDWPGTYLYACLATGLVAPLVGRIARRIERFQAKSPGLSGQ